MGSWRDVTQKPVQRDLDTIVATSIDAARRALEEDGEFCPFGIVMTVDGDTRTAVVDAATAEQTQAQTGVDVVYASILREQNGIRAAAVVSDVSFDRSAAIRVWCEHRNGGPALEVLLRYRKHRPRGMIEYGLSSVSDTERRVWPVTSTIHGSEVQGSQPRRPAESPPIRWRAIVKLLVVTPVCLVVALVMILLGSWQATTFDGPIPLTVEELWTGRVLVIAAGLLACAPFAVAAWKLRRGRPLAFWTLVVVASLLVAASLGWALALPVSSDNTDFEKVSAWRG